MSVIGDFIYNLLKKRKKLILTILFKLIPYCNSYKHLSLYPNNFKLAIINKEYEPQDKLDFSIITPVLNEEENIVDLLKSIESQIFKPLEVIIVDGGSEDLTVEKILTYQKNSKLNIVVIHSPVKNIGYQRNLAIDMAKSEIIVNVDAGTFLDTNYTANLLGPFVEYKDLDLVCGVHFPKIKYKWSANFSPNEHFVLRSDPYGACIAYKRSKALAAGKYPEYLTYAGEDTLFLYKYKKLSQQWVFNKKAFILWEHPKTAEESYNKVLSYIKANFELGLWPFLYAEYLPILKIIHTVYWKRNVIANNYKKYLKNQAEIEIYKRDIKGLCIIVAKDDIVYSSSKIRNIAFEYIKNNYKTVFVNLKYNKEEVEKKIFYNIDHTLLEALYYKDFNLKTFIDRYNDFFINESIFIIDFADSFCLSLIDAVKKINNNIKIIYCLNSTTEAINMLEKRILKSVDVIIATKLYPQKTLTDIGVNDKLCVIDDELLTVSTIENFISECINVKK